ncbi:unnamed protein product [Peniophora sp. CBMAI 1063]|nr:unnamed protein product [Peniophora sp. CBMAI 1063]
MAQFALPTIHAPVVSAKERKKRDSAQPPKRSSMRTSRSSKLGMLSLDILYMILALLAPGDLVNLSRTNKMLRGVLLSRRSSTHVWKRALAGPAAFNCPPCPEDVSEPVWANLLFGEPRCTSCGSGDDTTVTYWELRARLCSQCEKTCLCRTSKVEGSDPSAASILPTDYVFDRNVVHSRIRKMSNIDCFEYESAWREDVQKYERLKQGGHLRGICGTRRSMQAAKDMRERVAEACVLWAAQRDKARVLGIRGQKNERIVEIRNRLLALGYESVDINHSTVQKHKELKSTQRMTDKVWQRVGPILCQVLNQLREERLAAKTLSQQSIVTARADQLHAASLRQDRELRANAVRLKVAQLYASLLKRIRVAPTSFSFLPGSLSFCGLSPPIAAILAEAHEISNDDIVNLKNVVASSLPSIRIWMLLRADAFRKCIPASWPKAVAPSPPLDTPLSESDVDVYAHIADLDLAVYTTRCRRHHSISRAKESEPLLFGLDALAHNCSSGPCQTIDLNISIRKDSHDTVLRILELLDLDPKAARPLDLDRMNEPFVTTCSTCLDDAEREYQRGKPSVLYTIVKGKARPVKSTRPDFRLRLQQRSWCPMNWRHAVMHMNPTDLKPHRCPPRSLRLLTPDEKAQLELAQKGEIRAYKIQSRTSEAACWGCCHCQVQLAASAEPHSSQVENWRPRTMLLHDVQQHLSDAHGIASGVEGTDMFFDRCVYRDERWSFPHTIFIKDTDTE